MEPLTDATHAIVATVATVARLRAAGCVFAEEEAALLLDAAGSAAELDAMVARRCDGEPLEQVIGYAVFCGLRIAVEPGVFVPRHRTEFLVRAAIERTPPRAVVVDLCCGTGAIGAAVAEATSPSEWHAADVDPVATACARRTVEPRGGAVHTGDLFDALPSSLRGRIEALLVNAPYVPTAEIPFLPPEARDHEAAIALDGGDDGLDVHRRVIASANDWLAPTGRLFVEVSDRQLPALLDALAAHHLTAEVLTDHELDATVVVAARG
ncbi:MAG: release factor glutamine methyltransferase [Frankiaceae bacterium]|jgi:release factor glutamine methyltransferase|nr:release factor glutamine methyltransferase [Frankiaceae bacterium]